MLPFFSTFAEESATTPKEKQDSISTKCSSIKQFLKRVQNSDKNTRVSLGSSFQTISNNFITPLNVRFLKNNQFNSDLNTTQTDYAEARTEFNQLFISYSQEFEELLNIDCVNNPDSFYHRLQSVRNKRTEVAKSVEELKSIIEKHVSTVKNLRNNPRSENE